MTVDQVLVLQMFTITKRLIQVSWGGGEVQVGSGAVGWGGVQWSGGSMGGHPDGL